MKTYPKFLKKNPKVMGLEVQDVIVAGGIISLGQFINISAWKCYLGAVMFVLIKRLVSKYIDLVGLFCKKESTIYLKRKV
jgi:hypothetical protein